MSATDATAAAGTGAATVATLPEDAAAVAPSRGGPARRDHGALNVAGGAAEGEAAKPPAMTHGTYSTYARGCRCEACATYQRDRVRKNRQDRMTSGRLNHGTRSAYDAGCRCRDCRHVRIWADWRNGHSRTHPDRRTA